jgi:hypothetical protein
VEHVWDRVRLLKAEDAHGPYEAFRCPKCGVSGRKRGEGNIVLDARYADPVFGKCDTARIGMKKIGGRRY